MDLTEFLTARLDEDEETACYGGPARIAWLTYRESDGQMRYTTVAAGGESDDDGPWFADGEMLPEPASARTVYDPARALREVAAKRAIIAAYERAPDWIGGEDVRYLAAVYSDHPDYRDEWKAQLLRG